MKIFLLGLFCLGAISVPIVSEALTCNDCQLNQSNYQSACSTYRVGNSGRSDTPACQNLIECQNKTCASPSPGTGSSGSGGSSGGAGSSTGSGGARIAVTGPGSACTGIPTPPAARVVAQTGTSITLRWNRIDPPGGANRGCGAISGYVVQRVEGLLGVTDASPFADLAELPVSAFSANSSDREYVDNTPAPCTAYTYRVAAFRRESSGRRLGAWSRFGGFTTPTGPNCPQSAPVTGGGGAPGGPPPAPGGAPPAPGGAPAPGASGLAAIPWDNTVRRLNAMNSLSFVRFRDDGTQRTQVTTGTWDCVTDPTTGLTWEIKTNQAGLRNQTNTFTWYNPDPNRNGGEAGMQNGGTCPGAGIACDTNAYVAAVNAMNGRGLCGYNNWRLPTLSELLSIIDFDLRFGDPQTDEAFFPNSPGDDNSLTAQGPTPYWTTHTGFRTENGATTATRAVGFLINGTTRQTGLGSAYIIDPPKTRAGLVRLVRSDAPPPVFSGDITGPNTCMPLAAGESRRVHLAAPTSRFQINTNGTAQDLQTNLMWTRCAMGQTLDPNGECVDAAAGTAQAQDRLRPWSGAVQRVQALNTQNYLGFNNWRLPTMKELVSLMEPGCNSYTGNGFIGTGLNHDVFPIWRTSRQPRVMWTSTPARTPWVAWTGFFGGSLANGPSNLTAGWMLVRDVP